MNNVTALNGPPQAEFVDGKRVLSRDLVLDLGAPFYELEWWAAITFHNENGGSNWAVSRSYEGNTIVRVMTGFKYDGASIPGWAQSFIMGPKENYEVAGCVHDMLYRLQAPRDVADSIFRWIARSGEKNVGPVRGFLGWGVLRLAGWVAYRENGKKANE